MDDDIDIDDVHTFDGSSAGWVNAVDPPQPSSLGFPFRQRDGTFG